MMELDDRSGGSPVASASPLSPSDALLWDALPALNLNIAQTAALCGISVRQLGYWTKQGYVKAIGRGARRLYGLDSLRRILMIRKAMQGGASLRQAVRALTASSPSTSGASPREVAAMPTSGSADPRSLPDGYADVLAASLLALFNANRHTRDNARGLATKIGRAEDDVRLVADSLCAAGLLTRVASWSDIIFRRADDKEQS